MITSNFDSTSECLKVALSTDLLSSNAETAARALEEQLQQTPSFKIFIVDLTACQMVDSVGLNLLFSLLNRCKETGSQTKVLISPGRLDRIMQVAQMGKLFNVEVVNSPQA